MKGHSVWRHIYSIAVVLKLLCPDGVDKLIVKNFSK